jgi:hypothetical protein
MYNCTELLVDGICTCGPCWELRVVLPETRKDYEGSEMEVLVTMQMYDDLCGFYDDNDLEIETVIP